MQINRFRTTLGTRQISQLSKGKKNNSKQQTQRFEYIMNKSTHFITSQYIVCNSAADLVLVQKMNKKYTQYSDRINI